MVSVQYEPHFSMFPGHHHHHPHHQNTWSCAAPPPICYQQQPPTPQYNTQDISGQYHHHHHHLQHMSHSVVQHYQDNSSYSPHHSAPPPWLYAAQAPAPRAMEWSPPFATTIQRDNSVAQQHQASATQSNCFDILQRQEHSPSLPSPSSISETSAVGDRVNQSNLGQGSPAKSDSPSYAEWLKKSEYDNLAENKKWKTRTKEKYRVVYSDRQRLELEKEFHYNRYITLNRKAEISKALDLTERQVKIWFQNRRAKERKENKKRTDKELSSPSSSTKSGLEDDVKDRFMDISSSVQATSPEMKVRELSPPLNQQLMYRDFSDNEPIMSSRSSSSRGLSGGNLVSQPNYRDSNTVQHSGHSMISPTRSFVHIKDDNLGIPSIKSEYTL